jgi:probable rRNA maturation factor
MSGERQTSLLFHIATPSLARRDVRAFAKRLTTEVSGGRSFCCLITSDEELRRLNRDFRKKDQATDVLAFPASSGAASGGEDANRFLGEIAISFERAREQAAGYGLAVIQEIEILMLHGLLHLVGMDHETDGGRMARAEAKWRAALGLPQGLIERART